MVRNCTNCGAVIRPWWRSCSECGADAEPTRASRARLTESGKRRAKARDRLLVGMYGAPCVCGLRGPHECTRTVEWWKDNIARMSARQQI